jgi:hypothetical protein
MQVWGCCCERTVKRRTMPAEQTLWTLNQCAHADWRNSQGLYAMQGLDDHCHMPTLEVLPRNIPVVAQATAAAACRYVSFLLHLMTGMSCRVMTCPTMMASMQLAQNSQMPRCILGCCCLQAAGVHGRDRAGPRADGHRGGRQTRADRHRR